MLVSTGNEVRSFDVTRFQAETLDKARRALGKVPAEERDIRRQGISRCRFM